MILTKLSDPGWEKIFSTEEAAQTVEAGGSPVKVAGNCVVLSGKICE